MAASRKKQQTAAARAELATRRSSHKVATEEPGEGLGAGASTGSRPKRGQAGKKQQLDANAPAVPANPPNPTRPRPRPKLRQVSQPPPDINQPIIPVTGELQNESADLPTKNDADATSKLVEHPESKGTSGSWMNIVLPDSEQVPEFESIPAGWGASEPVMESHNSVPVEGQSDSDVMVIDMTAEGESNEIGLWESDAENATTTVMYKVSSSKTRQARTAWADVQYGSDEPAEAPVLEERVQVKTDQKKPQTTTHKQGRVASAVKDEKAGVVAKAGNKASSRTSKVAPNKNINAKRREDSDGSVDEDNGADSEDSSDSDLEGHKPVAEGVELLHIEVPRLQAVRVLKLRSDLDYESFCEKIARVLDCSANDLNLGYSAGKVKDLKGKLTPRVLENKADYAEMIARAVKAIGDERRRYKKEKRDLSKAAKKAKGKAGAPIKRKAVGIQDYIIRLALMDVDEKTKKSAKKKNGSTTGASSGVPRDGSDSDDKGGMASKQLDWFARLKAKHACATHDHTCVVMPGVGNEAGTHVRLQRSDLLHWAERLAIGDETVSILNPPKSLNLYDRIRKEGKEQTKGESAGHGDINKSNMNAPQATPPMPVPPNWFFGQPGMFYPPYPHQGGFHGPHPGYPQLPTAEPVPPRTQPRADPLLSEWLVECDSGPRGSDGHSFASFLPALNASWITRLSDIARLTTPKDLIDCTSEHPPKMPFGTASRLLDYAKTDYK